MGTRTFIQGQINAPEQFDIMRTAEYARSVADNTAEIERLKNQALGYDISIRGYQAQVTDQAVQIKALGAERDAALAEVERLTPLQYRQAPCHKFCESTAYEIEARGLKAEIERLKAMFKLVMTNLEKGMPKSIQRMQAREIWEFLK
jgi:hypothetical protein